jgi:hypothetical protein
MVTVLEECTTQEQNSAVRFLWAKRLNAKDIHKEIFPVYGGKCVAESGSQLSEEILSRTLESCRSG